ncbi:MAG: hypothetical protein AB7P52_17825 [Alphaproteobacteria bacterium]
MPRELAVLNDAAAQAAHLIPVVFIELDFPTEPVRVNTGDRAFIWGGMTFHGIAEMGRIEPFGESTNLSVEGFVIELNGLPAQSEEDVGNIERSLAENIQGRRARAWLGFLDETTYQLVDDPDLIFRGRMDVMSAIVGETASVAVHVENRLADWDRPRVRRYTHADQVARFPADKGLEFVSQTTEREILWGRG